VRGDDRQECLGAQIELGSDRGKARGGEEKNHLKKEEKKKKQFCDPRVCGLAKEPDTGEGDESNVEAP